MKSLIPFCCLLFMCISCVQNTPEKEEVIIEKEMVEKKVSVASQIAKLKADGFQIFDYVDDATGDTVIMQQYYMAFLKKGPNRDQSEEEAAKLQEAHQAHLGRMYELGYADISGPFGDDGDLRGMTVYNVPTLKMADSLANLDPMMKAGRLMVEIKPWWAGKGYPLR
ncbi:YciI family protein [Dokdonia pacifica]|uniref:Uncharacterized conserved protein YciI, contains a putative active-site phosphohistidine n=1 Tax=Dokdonia pacifica TaxID=1627892 RepID=A0A238W4C7_9FLAO|nr:YciI family protein [Dokdonia pacifica]SNR40569.1 Uncharacterized conserved protein YciI, contains a putative active-site phosphohistidine [Dokdonia pacifica]